MMKWMHQCRGVSSNWHHLSDVCYGGGVVVSAAVATTLWNTRLGARKKRSAMRKLRLTCYTADRDTGRGRDV